MQKDVDLAAEADKKMAAVCGLYCQACTWFIATTEYPEKLKKLADQQNWSVKQSRCFGCRSEKRIPYCENCKMFACAAQRGIDFCSECDAYPCQELVAFQAEMPHRIELWDNLEKISRLGYKQWLKDIRSHYTCPNCQTLNSTYNLKCRKCRETPSCGYVAKHRQQIEHYLKNR